MTRRSTLLSLVIAATLAVAGCGQDNTGNDNEGGTPTPTRTAAPATRTPTPTPVVSTSGVLTVTPTGGVVPTPTVTVTPTTGGGCGATELTLTLTTVAGSDLDTGYSGIAFNQGSLVDTQVKVNLDCPDGDNCTIDGSALKDTPLGSPLPLTAGGVSTCILNTFREGVTGTYNCTSGCSESAVRISSQVFQKSDPEKPCPVCVGDDVPNDGVKNGTCSSDAVASGAPCDVNGISETGLGSTSNDCLPTGSDIGVLAIDLVPFTTGTATLAATIDCADGTPSGCFCPGQISQNQCRGGTCAETADGSGECEEGPPVGRCSGRDFFLKCTSTGTTDCGDLYPGAGTCEFSLQKCIFGTTITRTGTCAPPGLTGVAVSTFCIPATRTPAINTVTGLPGPGAATLPATTVRVSR